MKLQEIKVIAQKKGIKTGSMKKAEIIRAIQRTEGNRDCFGTRHIKECEQMNCLWRADCLAITK